MVTLISLKTTKKGKEYMKIANQRIDKRKRIDGKKREKDNTITLKKYQHSQKKTKHRLKKKYPHLHLTITMIKKE